METVTHELQGVYDQVSAAFRAKDLDRVMRFIHPDWVGEAQGQRVTREELQAHVAHQFATLDDIDWPRTISDLRPDGDQVTVRSSGPYRARNAETGEPVELQLTNDDRWIHTDAGWLNIHSVAIA
jgi:ketosteroid isomerase-like protein